MITQAMFVTLQAVTDGRVYYVRALAQYRIREGGVKTRALSFRMMESLHQGGEIHIGGEPKAEIKPVEITERGRALLEKRA